MRRPVQIRVLGTETAREAGFFAPSLLVGQHVLIDAGSFGAALTVAEQRRIDHVVLSHAHHDHVKDLAEFADLVIADRKRPVQVHASRETLRVLREHLFNNRLWPDFFSLPSPENAVLAAAPFEPRKPFTVSGLQVRAIPVNHPVETMGFIVRTPDGSFVYSGDTGPTEELWRVANRLRRLKLLLIETKFPNELQLVADAAGHLTPRTLAAELRKIRAPGVPVVLYHLKPDRRRMVKRQIRALGDERLRIMHAGDRYRL